MNQDAMLVTLAVQFAIIALLSFGGANAVLPEMHRQAVELHSWVTGQQFADMFAISQVVPGPNVMIVTLIGFHLAGLIDAGRRTVAIPGNILSVLEDHLAHYVAPEPDALVLPVTSRAPGIGSSMPRGGRSSRRGWPRSRSVSSRPVASC